MTSQASSKIKSASKTTEENMAVKQNKRQVADTSFILTLMLSCLWNLSAKAQTIDGTELGCLDGWTYVENFEPTQWGVCIWPSDTIMTLREANRTCNGFQAELVIPPNDYFMEELEMDASKRGRESIWINAKVENGLWYWDTGPLRSRKHTQLQGCWDDDPADPDLPYTVKSNSSVEDCTMRCMIDGYNIASVQYTPSNEFMCRCGSKIMSGKHGRRPFSDCLRVCPDAPKSSPFDTLCGNTRKQVILMSRNLFTTANTDDSLLHMAKLEFAFWNRTTDAAECIAINKVIDGLKWEEKDCWTERPFFCQYQRDMCPIDGVMVTNNKCVELHKEPMSWFGATAFCMSNGGILLNLDGLSTTNVDETIGDMIKGPAWIGLSIFKISKFSNGAPLAPYNGWAEYEPLYDPDTPLSCVESRKINNYRWSTTPCTEQKHFYCVKNPTYIPTTEMYTTGTTPTSEEESSYEVTDPPPPRPGSQTGGLSPVYIGAIGAGVGVGFVLLIICLVFACRRCKSKGSAENEEAGVKEGVGKPRRLPSIPGGGRGVHRIKGKTVRYTSDPVTSLNHLPPEIGDDDGEYDYIELALKKTKEGATDEDGVKVDEVEYEVLEKSIMDDSKNMMDYEGLKAKGIIQEDNYVIPMEPPADYKKVQKATKNNDKNSIKKEKAPMGMIKPTRVSKTTVEDLIQQNRESARLNKGTSVNERNAHSDKDKGERDSLAAPNEDTLELNKDTNEDEEPMYADKSDMEASDDDAEAIQGEEDDDNDNKDYEKDDNGVPDNKSENERDKDGK